MLSLNVVDDITLSVISVKLSSLNDEFLKLCSCQVSFHSEYSTYLCESTFLTIDWRTTVYLETIEQLSRRVQLSECYEINPRYKSSQIITESYSYICLSGRVSASSTLKKLKQSFDVHAYYYLIP